MIYRRVPVGREHYLRGESKESFNANRREDDFFELINGLVHPGIQMIINNFE